MPVIHLSSDECDVAVRVLEDTIAQLRLRLATADPSEGYALVVARTIEKREMVVRKLRGL